MKKQYYILFLIFLSCYNDDSRLIESPNLLHRSSEMTTLLKSISLHHASFDDYLDNTSCFSLVFPYQAYVNEELTTLSSQEDVLEISNGDNIEIVFPVQVAFFNYEIHEIKNKTEFQLATHQCEKDFDIKPNPCMQFEFPLVVRKYNILTQNFDTQNLKSNIEVFTYFDNLHQDDRFEIDYPITLWDSIGNSHQVLDNSDFISAFYSTIHTCQ